MTEVVVEESRIGDVEGKVAIVTGGASGIGKAIVNLLHKRGAIVIFCDLNVSAGEAIATELGKQIEFITSDVTVWKDLRRVFSHAKQNYGHVDIVFANAGVVQSSSIWDDTVDEEGDLGEPEMLTLDVNLNSVIWTAKLAMHYFKLNMHPGGSLVISASSSSYNERPNLPLYSIAKHGLLGLMRALRADAPKVGVSVSCIAPAATASGMVDAAIVKAAEAQGIIVQTPEYVALAAVMLASNKDWNGKSVTLMGFKATDVEGKIQETMPIWYGKHNMEMAARAASVVVKK